MDGAWKVVGAANVRTVEIARDISKLKVRPATGQLLTRNSRGVVCHSSRGGGEGGGDGWTMALPTTSTMETSVGEDVGVDGTIPKWSLP